MRKSWTVSKSKGFTLLELLVVITILGLVMTLVSPLAAERVQKAKARAEFLEFKGQLKLASLHAFTRGISTEITLHDHYATRVDSDGEKREISFEYIHFPSQQFVINTNGYPSVAVVTVNLQSWKREISFHEIVGTEKDAIYAD